MYRKSNANLLVITDIHCEADVAISKQRADRLVAFCLKVIRAEKIDCILILGDVCNQGKSGGEYFTSKLMGLDSLKGIRIFMIPGNHDLDRRIAKRKEYKGLFFQSNDKRIDPIQLQKSIRNESALVKRMKKELFEPYLKAYKNIDKDLAAPFYGIDFIPEKSMLVMRLNSCWNAIDSSTDFGKIIISQDTIEELDKAIRVTLNDHNLQRKDVTITTLVHHPPSWWYYSQLYNTSPNFETVYNIMVRNSDLIICGHTHGTYTGYSYIHDINPVSPNQSGRSVFIESPAAQVYEDDYYPSSVTLLKLSDGHTKIERTTYLYSNRDGGTLESTQPVIIRNEEPRKIIDSSSLPSFGQLQLPQANHTLFESLAQNKDQCIEYAKSVIQSKWETSITIPVPQDNYFDYAGNVWVPFLFAPEGESVESTISSLVALSDVKKDKNMNMLILYRDRDYLGEDVEVYLLNLFMAILKKEKQNLDEHNAFLYLHQVS